MKPTKNMKKRKNLSIALSAFVGWNQESKELNEQNRRVEKKRRKQKRQSSV